MPDESGSWPTVVSEMKTQLTAAGYAVEAKYAGANAQTQIAQIEALIAKNVSCLVITARAIIDSGIGSKLTSYVISGQDAEAASLEYIKSDKQSMTIWKSHAEMAKKTAGVVNQILKGETPSIDKTIDNGVKVIPFIKGDFKLITKANVDIVK